MVMVGWRSFNPAHRLLSAHLVTIPPHSSAVCLRSPSIRDFVPESADDGKGVPAAWRPRVLSHHPREHRRWSLRSREDGLAPPPLVCVGRRALREGPTAFVLPGPGRRATGMPRAPPHDHLPVITARWRWAGRIDRWWERCDRIPCREHLSHPLHEDGPRRPGRRGNLLAPCRMAIGPMLTRARDRERSPGTACSPCTSPVTTPPHSNNPLPTLTTR